MEAKIKSGSTLILKRDFPPFPIGTHFKARTGCNGEVILETPTFGEILPNGEKIPSMSVKNYFEYAKIFEAFGGWQEWFDVKPRTEIMEWSSHCIRFKGAAIDLEIVEQIKLIVK